jgi:MFS transporter, DHA1 family, multidrug resistance protein
MTRRRLAWTLGALSAIGPLSIDTALPAFPSIGRSLGATVPAVQLTLAAYLAGILAGQLVHGPLSDRLGRRPPLIGGLGLYSLASIAAALAPTLAVLWGARFAQGLGACAVVVVSRAVVRDRCGEQDAAALHSSRMLVSGVAPVVAPLLGGQLVGTFGWRAIFGVLAAAGLALAVLVARTLPESFAPERARRGGVSGALRGAAGAFRDRRFVRLSLVGGASEAALFAALSASPFLFIERLGMSPERYGLVGAANAAGVVAASLLNRRLVRALGVSRVLRIGTAAAAAAYAALAFAVHSGAGLAAVLVAMVAGVSTLGLVLPSATAAAMDLQGERAGSASAVLGILQSTCGVLASFAVSLLADGTALPMATVMLACGITAFALVRVDRASSGEEGVPSRGGISGAGNAPPDGETSMVTDAISH